LHVFLIVVRVNDVDIFRFYFFFLVAFFFPGDVAVFFSFFFSLFFRDLLFLRRFVFLFVAVTSFLSRSERSNVQLGISSRLLWLFL
jgi:hypothetical protein